MRRFSRVNRTGVTAKALVTAMATLTLWATGPALGDPADIFDIGAPAVGSEPPKAADIQVGDTSVATQTGNFQYSYPIDVPPGRNGMQPHLALTYSSQAPIYGGIANGWTLSIPTISLDTSAGRMWHQDAAFFGPARYVSSMAGGHPLVEVNELADTDVQTTYRAKNDSTFTRYERLKTGFDAFWRARTTDGQTYAFGEATHVNGSFTGTAGCSDISQDNAPLTHVMDSFGNAVDYYYERGAANECRIAVITWGQNSSAGISDFARLTFNYTIPATPGNCPAGTQIGAQSSLRTGTAIVTGASQLNSIVATAYAPGQYGTPVHTRTIRLAYTDPNAEDTATCTTTHAAYRSLYSIQETAVGTDAPLVTLPAVKFSYGSAQFGTGALAWPSPTAHTNPFTVAPPVNGATAGTMYNLGWGYRFNDASGRWPTVEAMMLDVDGDGLLDRVFNSPNIAKDKYHCRAQWIRNKGNLQFETTVRDIAMPTLKWATKDESCGNPNRYDGGAMPNEEPSRPVELCALNYQRTDYQNTPKSADVQCLQGGCPAVGYCDDLFKPDYGTPCNQLPSPGPTYFAYRWMDIDGDGLVDLVASPTMGSVYNLEQGMGLCGDTPPPEPAMFGKFPKCPTSSGANPPGNAFTMCSNRYPWMIYRNHGNGQFGVASSDPATPLPDKVVYQPISLESDTGDSSLTAGPVGQNLGTLDFDGDGYPDGVNAVDASPDWGVFRNDMTGAMSRTSAQGAFIFEAGGAKINQRDASQGNSGLFDINGDGYADNWFTPPSSTTTSFELNDGNGFQSPAAVSTSVSPSPEMYLSCYGGCSSAASLFLDPHGHAHPSSIFWIEAQRWDSTRIMDVDLDGRQDVVQFLDDGKQTPATHLNQGGGLQTTGFPTIGDTTSLHHKMVATDDVVPSAAPPTYTWEIRSDVIDLDGDGIPEDVSFSDHGSAIGTMYVGKIQTPTEPPRLLVGIDNQRGATTSIAYAAMSDSSVVTRDPGLVMPKTGWVVHTVTSTDSISETSSTTTYNYKNPHYSVEGDLTKENGTSFPPPSTVDGPSKTWSFRGFDEVTTTNPSRSKVTQRYKYDVDWSGRLVESLVIPAEFPNEVRSIDLTTWEPRYLFCDTHRGCSLKTYHATVTEHRVCKNGQDEAACLANKDGVSRSLSTLTAIASSTSGGAGLLFAETSRQRTGADGASEDGDLVVDTEYVLASDATNYRLLTFIETNSTMQGSTKVAFAKTTHTFDSMKKVTETDNVWLDAAGQNQASTRRVFDMSTGNVLEHWKPVQNAANTRRTVYTYDARKLFPIAELDEGGNELDYAYEYGTGTKLDTVGPNMATCTATGNCPAGSLTKQEQRIRVDGLGRTIERWDTFSADGAYYTPYKIETFTYADGTIPNSITHQTAITANTSTVVAYAQDQTDLDGHGRTVKNAVYVSGSAPFDQITRYEYGDDGTLQAVNVPDPSANSAQGLVYTYTYDSLGRPTGMRRPDASVISDQSGVNIAYDGLTTTTTEVVVAGGGHPAATKTIKDAFGRLTEVDEGLDGTLLNRATTTYGYDAADRVTTIIDPENLTTTIDYDFAGNRCSIARPSGKWTFTYDKNNNLASLTTPHTCALGDACDPRYVTTFAYDDLDRMTSKLLAHRELSNDDLTLFAADKETFLYDAIAGGHKGNYKGELISVKSFAPGASNPAVTLQLVHDAQGHDWKTTETFAAAGYNSIGARTYTETFAVSGQPNQIQYGDGVGNAAIATSAIYHYDARGLPASISLTRTNQGTQTVAVQTRNVAGLVTNRKTTITGTPTSPMTFVESNWTYDALGRVASQIVQKGPGPTLVAEQALTYFGNDDPHTLDQYLGASHRHFVYDYDYRHQLLSAGETTTSGYFSGKYSYGAAGRFLTATEDSPSPAPGSEVKPRDVTYKYGSTDPEQVTALRNATSGTTYASYSYDPSGNQTERCYGTMPCAGESTEYVYDGDDRLRRATKKQNGAVVSSEEYWYDGRGSRMATVKRDASGAKTELIWWNGDTEAHYDGTGTLQHVYSYINLGTPVARTDRDGSGTAKLEFTFHGLGNSTLATVDRDTGTVNASFSYAPFGEIIEATDAGGSAGAGVAAHRRRMNDKYVDEVSDLAYYGARYYDKTLMMWTQADPLFRFAPDAAWDRPRNTLLYTNDLNDPLRYIDPDGRAPFIATITGQGALYDAVGQGNTSSATVIQTGLSTLDSVSNPAAYAKRGSNEAVAAVESAKQGDVGGMMTHLSNAQTETAIAIVMVIAGGEEAGEAAEPTADVGGVGDVSGVGEGGCFVAGTPVSTPHGEVPIEQLRLGDRVASDNARCASDHIGSDVRAISLEVVDPNHPDSQPTDVEIARPLSWLRGQRFTNGAFWLALPEVGQGWARVTKIGARPHEQQGPGCLVLMTVHHPATEILDFQFVDGSTFEVTPSHPLYLEGRGWTVADEIAPGSVLRSASGQSVVTTVEPGAPNRTVYNLEVSLDHVYRIGTAGVWAHNSCPAGGQGGTGATDGVTEQSGTEATDQGGKLSKLPRGKGKVPESQRDPRRSWSDSERAAKRTQQNHKCANGCGTDIDASNSNGHHKNTRWADGGKTDDANHAEVCIPCHKTLH